MLIKQTTECATFSHRSHSPPPSQNTGQHARPPQLMALGRAICQGHSFLKNKAASTKTGEWGGHRFFPSKSLCKGQAEAPPPTISAGEGAGEGPEATTRGVLEGRAKGAASGRAQEPEGAVDSGLGKGPGGALSGGLPVARGRWGACLSATSIGCACKLLTAVGHVPVSLTRGRGPTGQQQSQCHPPVGLPDPGTSHPPWTAVPVT